MGNRLFIILSIATKFLQNPWKDGRAYIYKQPGFLHLRSIYIENANIKYNWILKLNSWIKFVQIIKVVKSSWKET